MNILSVDTSAGEGSVALLQDAAVTLYERSFRGGRGEGGGLFEALEEALQVSREIDRIVVGLGPGSYSGIRQAVAAVQGLRFALKPELAGLPSACGVSDEEAFCYLGDARRGMVYFTRVQMGLPLSGPLLLGQEEAQVRIADREPVYSMEQLASFPTATVRIPSARILGLAALKNWEAVRGNRVAPFYLRDPNITVPKDPPKLRQA